jgi:hypothetical protein
MNISTEEPELANAFHGPWGNSELFIDKEITSRCYRHQNHQGTHIYKACI